MPDIHCAIGEPRSEIDPQRGRLLDRGLSRADPFLDVARALERAELEDANVSETLQRASSRAYFSSTRISW